jgi:hypothetical protein
MKPTTRLRFTERFAPLHQHGAVGTLGVTGTKLKVLQQWWEDEYGKGQWRDVQMEGAAE